MIRRRVAPAALVVSGLLLLLHGFWIPAKAALAQVLLEEAWSRARRGGEDPRPWAWADTWPVARLRAPSRDWSAIVLAGASGGTLAFGPGHLTGSAEPGAVGNSVLAGHRDTHFSFLGQLRSGEELLLETRNGETQRYVVTGTRVVHERDPSPLAASDDFVLTLITCFPFDAPTPGGPLRYVVQARREPL